MNPRRLTCIDRTTYRVAGGLHRETVRVPYDNKGRISPTGKNEAYLLILLDEDNNFVARDGAFLNPEAGLEANSTVMKKLFTALPVFPQQRGTA